MISTSSSECDCTGSFGLGPAFPNILGNPFISSAARQPLIYFAKIQEPFFQQNTRKRKLNDNSNYFMKAFRWYTEERGHGGSHGNESHVNNSGFAAWLDEKYNEYRKGYQRKSNQISKVSSNFQVDGTTKKRKSKRNFGRIPSPWRSHRQPHSRESNLNQSLQYILEPQNISGTVSECCPRTSRMQSTTTIISKTSPKAAKIKVKSKSLLSIYRAKDQHDPRQFNPKSKGNNVLCECLNKDAGTQYETCSLETFANPCNPRRSPEPQGKKTSWCSNRCIEANVTTKIRSQTDILCGCTNVMQREVVFNRDYKEKQTLENQMSVQPTSEAAKANVMFTDNTNENMSVLQNLSAQTSDHSINLGHILNEHPLFLRVVQVSK